jgi:poly(3-hydroxybutyrate) depolymerase
MLKKVLLLATLAWLAIFTINPARSQTLDYTKNNLVSKNTNVWPLVPGHIVHFPKDYQPSGGKGFPLLIYMHGLGQVGDGLVGLAPDGSLKGKLGIVETEGLPYVMKNATQAWKDANIPMIVVSPQIPKDFDWEWCHNCLLDMYNYAISKYNVDKNRVYFTGYSLGARGIYNTIRTAALHNKAAALVPIAWRNSVESLLDTAQCTAVKNTGLWHFHAEKDEKSPLLGSQVSVGAVNACKIGGSYNWQIDPVIAASDPRAQTFTTSITADSKGWNIHYGYPNAINTQAATLTVWADKTHNYGVNKVFEGTHGGTAYGRDGLPYTNVFKWMMTYSLDATPTVSNLLPVANAGADRVLTMPINSLSTTGTGTDSDGVIVSYAWTKVSGGAATIANADLATLSVSGMAPGVYVFRLTVTDNAGGVASDDVTVTVKAANLAPTSNAGPDRVITLPTNSLTLTGSGSDSDGSIVSYAWTKIIANTAVLANANSATLSLSGLQQGTYFFRLTVTDNQGATALDDVRVTVNAANAPPSANAGADKSITLPVNSVSIVGAGTDADGTVATYAWTKIAGGAAVLSNANTSNLTVSGLAQGAYTFRLTVTDNLGANTFDDVNVTVNPLANVAPIANAGPDKTITLPTNSVTLTGSGTDSDGTIAGYAWSQISGASASLANANAAMLTISGLAQGTYVFRLSARDNLGATGTDDVVVNVLPAVIAPQNSVTYKIDFGDNPTVVSGENSIVPSQKGTNIRLYDANGVISNVYLNVIGFNQVNSDGTTAPAAALGISSEMSRDSFFGNTNVFVGASAPLGTVTLTGLSQSKTYNLNLFASRMGVSDNRQTEYLIRGQIPYLVNLDVHNNTNKFATMTNIKPDSTGKITITAKAGALNTNSYLFYYLGGIVIHEQ